MADKFKKSIKVLQKIENELGVSEDLSLQKHQIFTLTTTGNLSLDELRVTAGTMLVDGEDVTVDDQLVVSGGTLQMTSGLIHNSYDGERTTISGGT